MKSFVLILVAVSCTSEVSTSVLLKKGNCPIVHESDHNCKRKINFECLLDFDCNNKLKCCRTACHEHKCVEPIRNRVCQRKSDIAFVLDASGSIGEKSFKNMKDVINKLIASFSHEKGYRHALVVYGEKTNLVFNNIATWKNWDLKTKDLVKMVNMIPYYGSPMTRINAALRLVHHEVFPRYKNQYHRTKMIVLLTDGIQSIPPYEEGLIEAGKVLDDENIKVFGVLTGEQRNLPALLNLVTNDQLIFEPELSSELIEAMSHETQYFC